MTEVVVTTSQIDVAYLGLADVTLSTSKVETMFANQPQLEVSTVKKETMVANVLDVKLSTSKVETFYSNTIVVPPPVLPTKLTARYNPVPCIPAPRSRFRKFWSTQVNACPSEVSDEQCNDPSNLNACTNPGLVLLPKYDPTFQQLDAPNGTYSACNASIVGATISTDNWVAGLVLNILGTNAQQAKAICGNRPGQKGGYWLDDISGAKSGSSIRYIPTKGYTINQQVAFVQQQAAADLNKLITYGVAVSVSVVAKYTGNHTVSLIITVLGVDDETTVVNSTMTKIANAWVWN